MRTAADLEDAFASLTEQADAYTAAHDDAVARPAPEVDLVHRPARRPTTPVAVGTALLAAAAVVTLAVGVGRWTGRDDTPGPAGGTPTHREGPAPRTYRVTLDPELGLRMLEVSTSSDATTTDWYDRRTHVQVTSIPASARQRLTPGLERVDLGRVGAGYYTDGTRSMFVEPPSDPATGGPVPTPTPPDTRYAKAVVVPLAAGAFVTVLIQGALGTKAQLVRLARGLVVRTTALTVPSAVSLSAAPAGMRLVSIDAMLHQAGDTPPYEVTGRNWFTDVVYEPVGPGDGISIQATSFDVTQQPRAGAVAITVAGHDGYWLAKDRELDLDFGGGRYLSVGGAVDGSATPQHTTRAELVAVARTLTLTSSPTRPARWFPATRALP